MKLSDYVARFLADRGIRHAFVLTGGASAHLIDSIAHTEGIDHVCPQHEQAGAMAADAYARVTGNLGVAISTSGPGATNMITGVCCAYYDSVPVIYITGQVASFRLKGDSGVRQLGFQETDIVEMYRPITNYAVQITRPDRIRYELEKAVHLATSGRPGPVVIDLPDDFQRAEVEPELLVSFTPPALVMTANLDLLAEECLRLIASARRPVAIVGFGVRLAGAEDRFRQLVERLGIPVAPTWAMMDVLPDDHALRIGTFGTHGTRYGNFAVQNADLVLAIGARLDTREAGSPITTFARGARKVVVDIDGNELRKFARLGLEVDLLVEADAGRFLDCLGGKLDAFRPPDLGDWRALIGSWKSRYPICAPEAADEKDVNPYVLVRALSRHSSPGDVIVVDTGCAVAWMMQAFQPRLGQRVYSAFNNTPMGYALPASIGASFATGRGRVTCVTGDGGLQINIQELATIVRHQLPITVFLLDNLGYSMIQQTQDQWLGSRYEASTVEGGLAFPDFVKVAQAYGLETLDVSLNADLDAVVERALSLGGPVFCNVRLRPERRVEPQVKFGRPIEDSEPLLPRDEFLANMIVPPHPSSLPEPAHI